MLISSGAGRTQHRIQPHRQCFNVGEIFMSSHFSLKFCILTFLLSVTLFYSCGDKTKTLSFKGCQTTYQQYSGGKYKLYAGHYITNAMELEAAQRKLALCLCEQFILTKDTIIRNKIIELYNEKESYFTPSEEIINTNNIDSIIQHRKDLFDTTIIID